METQELFEKLNERLGQTIAFLQQVPVFGPQVTRGTIESVVIEDDKVHMVVNGLEKFLQNIGDWRPSNFAEWEYVLTASEVRIPDHSYEGIEVFSARHGMEFVVGDYETASAHFLIMP